MNFKKPRLDLSARSLSAIPPTVYETRKIRKLIFRQNNIKDIPIEISKLTYLETLDFAQNKIRLLFAKTFSLNKLIILNFNGNQIVSIPKQISNLNRLKFLGLSNNKLKSLPPEFAQLESLEELDLSGNGFPEIPEVLFRLKNLKTLRLAGNPIVNFPVDRLLAELPNLSHIYCYSSKLNPAIEHHEDFISASKQKGNCLKFLKALSDEKAKSSKSVPDAVKVPKSLVFISYAHDDGDDWINRVKKNLRVLEKEGLGLDVWDDTRIKTGMKWQEEIQEKLDRSFAAILLVSTNFLASDFIRENELPKILKNAEQKGTQVIPLIISPCRYTKTEILKDFQSLNDPDQTFSEMQPAAQDRAFLKMVEAIEEVIKNAKG